MKRIVSLLLTAVLLCTLLSVFVLPASAEGEVSMPENATLFEDNGDNLVWWELTENDTGKTLTIGGEGYMPDFMPATDRPWHNDAGKITAVEINSGVTSIGSYAFQGCTSLKEVTIPGNVKWIGYHAFSECTGITTLTISEGVGSIEMSAFKGCISLKEVTIPGTVTSIGDSAFSDCTGITTLTISEGVGNIGSNAFKGCASLKELTIPGSVERIGENAFSECTGIATLTISEGVQSIESGAFQGCRSLKELTIPGSVERIGGTAFGSCVSLKEVTIPASVTSIGGSAFSACDPALVIHGKIGTAAAQYAKENGIDFFDNGKCKHFVRFTCDTCNTHLTRSELLKAWGENNLSGSILSGGGLTIIVGVVCSVVFLAVGAFGMYMVMKKKKPALAGCEENDE